jgi:hypothetical protein
VGTQHQACRIMGVREPIRWLYKVWGDGVCVKALSNTLNSNVFVFRKGYDDQPPHVFTPLGQHIRPHGVRDEPLRDNSINIEFDEKTEHYDALAIRQCGAIPVEPATGVDNLAGSADMGSGETEAAPTKRKRHALRRMTKHISETREDDVDGNEGESAAKKMKNDAGEPKPTDGAPPEPLATTTKKTKKLKKMSKRAKSARREAFAVVAARSDRTVGKVPSPRGVAAVPSPRGVAAVPSPKSVVAVPSPEGVAAGFGLSMQQIMPRCSKCKMECSKGKLSGKLQLRFQLIALAAGAADHSRILFNRFGSKHLVNHRLFNCFGSVNHRATYCSAAAGTDGHIYTLAVASADL